MRVNTRAVVAGLLVLLADPLLADEGGRIRGFAADEAGQALPGVNVEIHSGSGTSRTVKPSCARSCFGRVVIFWPCCIEQAE